MQNCNNAGSGFNLTHKFPNLRIIDKTSNDYQMEAVVYICVMLFLYSMATAGFMIQFIARREPCENELGGDMLVLTKFREREKRDMMIARETRKNIKNKVLQHLQTMNGALVKTRSEIRSRNDSKSRSDSIISSKYSNSQKKKPSTTILDSLDSISMMSSKTTYVTYYESDTLVSL